MRVGFQRFLRVICMRTGCQLLRGTFTSGPDSDACMPVQVQVLPPGAPSTLPGGPLDLATWASSAATGTDLRQGRIADPALNQLRSPVSPTPTGALGGIDWTGAYATLNVGNSHPVHGCMSVLRVSMFRSCRVHVLVECFTHFTHRDVCSHAPYSHMCFSVYVHGYVHHAASSHVHVREAVRSTQNEPGACATRGVGCVVVIVDRCDARLLVGPCIWDRLDSDSLRGHAK